MKITVPEAARRAGRNPETIRRWIWSGKLASEKVGTQHLVEEGDLERLAGSTGATRPGAWQRWARAVELTNREQPVVPGTFTSLEDIVDEARAGR